MPDDIDDHDLGFAHDLPRMIGRRGLLGLLAGGGLVAATPASAACVALPWETAGPFPADGTNGRSGQVVNALTQSGVIREDIRPSFNGLAPVAAGVTLDLEVTLSDAQACQALQGHAIYIWHCDAEGQYSLYDLTEANYLRGVGVSDGGGRVRFRTVVPGCYPGRWPHIHFAVFESAEAAVTGRASILTSQLAFKEEDCSAVYENSAAYPRSNRRNLSRLTLTGDGIFRDNTVAQLAQQTVQLTGDPDAGYVGTVQIPI